MVKFPSGCAHAASMDPTRNAVVANASVRARRMDRFTRLPRALPAPFEPLEHTGSRSSDSSRPLLAGIAWRPRDCRASAGSSPRGSRTARSENRAPWPFARRRRSEEHTSELQSQSNLVCRLLLEKKKKKNTEYHQYSERRVF